MTRVCLLARHSGLDFTEGQEIFLDEVNDFNIEAGYPQFKGEFYKKCNCSKCITSISNRGILIMQRDEDIRWKQRFQNFQSAYRLLEDAIAIKQPTEVERAGLIQIFEMTFELSWKLLKDYLEHEGFVVKTPRQVLKQAFQAEIIDDGEVWLRNGN